MDGAAGEGKGREGRGSAVRASGWDAAHPSRGKHMDSGEEMRELFSSTSHSPDAEAIGKLI